MTKWGWDTHHRDWDRGPMNLAKAKADGIDLFTAKSTEGSTYEDPRFGDAMNRARSVGFAVLGAYHVLWPNNPQAQADFWISRVNARAPWWRDHPCWIWQIDAELFQNFRPFRKPSVDELNACGDRIVAKTGCRPSQVVVYGPKWLYGDGLRGLKYRCLWASAYVNGSGGFKSLYPGDRDARWGAYSGMTPTILQYTSSATIAGQSPADANAVRVSTVADLQALFLGDDDDMTEAQFIEYLTAALQKPAVRQGLCDAVCNVDNIVAAPVAPTDPKGNKYWYLSSIVRGGYNQSRAANVASAAVLKAQATQAGQTAAVLKAVQDLPGTPANWADVVQAAAKAGTDEALAGYTLQLDPPDDAAG